MGRNWLIRHTTPAMIPGLGYTSAELQQLYNVANYILDDIWNSQKR